MGLILLFFLAMLLLVIGKLPTAVDPNRAVLHHLNTVLTRWQTAVCRFWQHIYAQLAHRFARIWRYCRRHYGWGVEVLNDPRVINLFM